MLKARYLVPLLVSVMTAATAHAQSWTVGAGAGPYIFGHFSERTFTVGTETGTIHTHQTLSAGTRVGFSIDVGHDMNDWLGWRAQGTFAHAPLAIKSASTGAGVTLNSGTVDVTSVALPLIVQLNRHGSFRFHLLAGPTWSSFDFHGRSTGGTAAGVDGTRSRFGGMAGAGVDWWLSDRLALEGEVADVVTASPLERSDFPSSSNGLSLPKTQTVHTTVGIRYRF